MNPRLKRFLIALGLVAAVVGFALLIWWQFFAPLKPGETRRGLLGRRALPSINGLLNAPNSNRQIINGSIRNSNQGLPKPSEVANGGATLARQLVTTPSQALKVADGGKNLEYYDPITGQFVKIGTDGKSKTFLTDKAFPGAETVVWSDDGNKVVLGFPDDSKVAYDFNKKQQVTLPKEAQDFAFSPEGDSLVFKFMGRDESDRWLTVSTDTGAEASFIEPIGDKAAQVTPQWSPNREIVATFAKGATGSQQEIIFLGTQGENFPSAKVAGRSFASRWSPDGQAILYTVRTKEDSDNPSLWVMDGRPDTLGQQQINLGLNTFIDKCGFAQTGSVVYCAVPKFLEPGSGIFPELSANSPDDIYRVDLRTGERRLVATPTDASGIADINATDVSVSSDETFLYFRDRRTNTINQLRLK